MTQAEPSGNKEVPLTFKSFQKIYEYPSYSALRKMAFESDHRKNKLQDAFTRSGRRRLVWPETLFRLLREMNSREMTND